MTWSALTGHEKAEIWRAYRSGEWLRSMSRTQGHSMDVLRLLVAATGGRPPRVSRRSTLRLAPAEREEISRGLVAGESCRMIARRIRRAGSTVSREIARNGGRHRYRAHQAEQAALRRARRPKAAKLLTCPRLRQVVEAKLASRWSPQQIAGWLRRAYPDDRELRVSHETIYMSLFVQPRARCARSWPATCARAAWSVAHVRREWPTAKASSETRSTSAPGRPRPPTVLCPATHEGDLLLGRANSALATLVERSSRFTVLVRLPDGRSSEPVLAALSDRIRTLPDQLVRSLTWDQGKEMALHAQFTLDTGLQIYICDPRSPWQRGTNENTNGLLRQYFPKGADLATITQDGLDAVAAELNGRPGQTLGWQSPSEKFAEAVAMTA